MCLVDVDTDVTKTKHETCGKWKSSFPMWARLRGVTKLPEDPSLSK